MRSAFFLLLAFCACRTRATPHDAAATTSAELVAEAGAPQLAPLDGHEWLEPLREGDTVIAYVSVPQGTREPRPIVVALHGAADRPEWSCGEWRGVFNAFAFVVCPVGTGAGGLYWSHPKDTAQKIAKSIAATNAAYGPYVRSGSPPILAGFSMGATQAALVAKADPKGFPYLAIGEGAYDVVPAMKYRGTRALLYCTTLGTCSPTYVSAKKTFGAETRVNVAGTNEHGINDTVVRSLRRDWPWLVHDIEGWQSYEPPREDKPLPGKTL